MGGRWDDLPLLKGEEPEAQGGQQTAPRSHSWSGMEQGLDSGRWALHLAALTTTLSTPAQKAALRHGGWRGETRAQEREGSGPRAHGQCVQHHLRPCSGPLTWRGEGKGFLEALLWPTCLSEGSVEVWGASWL